MKNLLLALALLIPSAAFAQNERSQRDINGEPTMLGISSLNGQIRALRTDDNGFLVITTTGVAASSTVDQGAAGVAEWLVVINSATSSVEAQSEAWTVPAESTATISNVSATQILAADATRKDATICNEESTAMRIGSPSITTLVGLRILGDSCVELGGGNLKPQGALSAIQTGGAPGKVSILEVR